ncbi:reticulon-like protein B9 [Nicotiana tabacum]|uniref:Reticulon-like protein n=1 Tax=Nicotiana tabacum TaxID=4097 RepID=A0A1S4AK97_TOBAC|nr:reticulon-like protein B9 [Nicotiana tomentosiformis]XP_016476843.1 PREDICTED: reticulon-like protein B9 [Nicotiana tabacum]
MPIYSSDSDDLRPSSSAHPRRFFTHEKPMHAILGGGKVADILLWRDRTLTAAILMGFTIIWSLFEVMEYNFVTLFCHISMILMLILFIWSMGAGFVDWSPPDFREIMISDSTFRWLCGKFNSILVKFYEISSGKDLRTFFLAITFLWILSVIGNYFSSLNLLYLGFMCLATLPALYERYQNEVDYLVSQGNQDMKKLYEKFDTEVLNKIPRGPVKQRKKY